MLRSLWPFTLRGTVMLAAGATGIAVGTALRTTAIIGVGISVALLTLFCLISLWLRPVARSVVRTITPAVVPAGTTVTVRVTASVGRDRAGSFQWRDEVRPEKVTRRGLLEPDRDGVALATYTVIPRLRGEHTFGPLWVSVTDPLGLARRQHAAAADGVLIVGPEVLTLDASRISDSAGAGGRTLTMRTGDGADDLVPRPYVRGDSRRRVHWKATAHRGDLMVRQEENEAAPTATVIIDREAPDDDIWETALSAAASVAVHLAEEGFCVDVVDGDGTALVSRFGGDEIDLLFALAHVTRGSDAHRTPVMARAAAGPVVVVAADAAAAAPRFRATAAGRTIVAVLTGTPGAVAGGRGVGDLRHGVSRAWSEAMTDDAR